MKYNYLGNSGLRVSELGFGAGTLGGKGPLFSAWGQASQNEADNMIAACVDAGVNFFDTADVYSEGDSERMLGKALVPYRQQSIVSTKVSLRLDEGINQVGFSRKYLLDAVEASLKRLQGDYIDVLQLHHFDSMTALPQLMATLDQLVRSGKVRYIGASNFSGWQLMKAQAIAAQYGYESFVTHQVYYSLVGREYEWDLMPLAHDQNIGSVVWSPLGWGRLTGKFDRQHPLPVQSRLHQTAQFAPPVAEEHLYAVIEGLQQVAAATGKSVPQVALRWLLQRPTVATVLVGARNLSQLHDNLAAATWQLSAEHMALLNHVSAVYPIYPHYPYWNGQFSERHLSLVDSEFLT